MTIKNILKQFDDLTKKGFDEHDVSVSLKVLLPEDKSKIDETLRSELMAFDFTEDYQDQKTGWGTYHGPMAVWNNGDGTFSESPSIRLITPEMINYWEDRAKESTNPILIARYSGLVWDFKNKISGTNPSHEICRTNIKALIDIANGGLHKYEYNTYKKLERALSLSIGLNDNDLITLCKETIINFENRSGQDTKPGLWGYAFDLLLENKRVKLSTNEEAQIIEELELKLERLTNKDSEDQKIDPWAAEGAAERLAVYYRKRQRNEDVRRVILKIGEAFNKIIDDASAMQASMWLDHLNKLYTKYNLVDEADDLLPRIRELGPKVASGLKQFTHSFEIPKKELEDYVESMTSGNMQDVLMRIAVRYIPIKSEAKEQIFDLSKNSPMMFLISHQLQDKKGRVVATIGPLENDLEGHIVRQISQNLYFSYIFLNAVIRDLIENGRLNKDEILKFISVTPIIEKSRMEIIEKGLDAYFSNDYLVFIHLTIPQIEEAVRNIIEFSGGNVLKISRGGGHHLRTFDDILRDEIIQKSLGEDFTDYFKILFTDQRGWNLRNSVCHGMASLESFNPQTADRVLHALLCLGLVNYE